jgi:hypothetical protein
LNQYGSPKETCGTLRSDTQPATEHIRLSRPTEILNELLQKKKKKNLPGQKWFKPTIQKISNLTAFILRHITIN